MITLEENSLVFRFPRIHQDAVLRLSFQRTLRIPDDDRTYPLPAGLGRFPLRHVDDFSEKLAGHITKRGGVMMPMWQAEAMWINFSTNYPFAIKVATGKVNAITGKEWSESLDRDPQDYLVVPKQPWLDGYCVEKGKIRQFVAMPLGSGQTAEEQLTQRANHGGLQILVHPIKPKHYNPHRPRGFHERGIWYSFKPSREMGLAAGGSIRQEIYEDTYSPEAWHTASSRLFVSLLNAKDWKDVAGELPPSDPISMKDYTKAKLPWFDWYAADQTALKGAIRLKKLKRLAGIGRHPEAGRSIQKKASQVISLGPQVRPVREFEEFSHN